MPRRKGVGDRELMRAIVAAGRRGANAASLVLLDKIVRLLSQRGHGRVYRSRKGLGIHRASSPGQPPAPDTGIYRGSWRSVDRSTATRVSVRVGTDQKRGPALEYGRRNMAPRPHARPGFNLARAEMTKQMAKALREVRL